MSQKGDGSHAKAMLPTCLQNDLSRASTAYQLKITLRGSKPAIWRRFVVPGDITLAALHDAIQTVMGWNDGHLHAFEIGGAEYTEKSRDGVSLDVDGHDERRFRLEDVVPVPKKKFRYVYDFGDGWEHTLLVEKTLPPVQMSETFVCLAGKGRCPPEDCGGIWGYHRLLQVLTNPSDPEHKEMLEWAGGEIDRDHFDLAVVNTELARFRN